MAMATAMATAMAMANGHGQWPMAMANGQWPMAHGTSPWARGAGKCKRRDWVVWLKQENLSLPGGYVS